LHACGCRPAALLAGGFARPYEGGKRAGWCG